MRKHRNNLKLFKVLTYISYLTVLIGLVATLVVTYWLVYPYKTTVFKDAMFPVVTKVVKSGANIEYISNYCKYINLPALATREFRNQLIFTTPSVITNRDLGCHVLSFTIPVPLELPPGKYILHQVYEYQVNPIRTVVLQHDTEPFTVVAN
jgi:hypothetical protein